MRTARIKVRLKGSNVICLITPPPPTNLMLMQHARIVAEQGDLDGFLVAGWTADGDTNIGWHTGQIRGYLAAAMISNAIEAELALNHKEERDRDHKDE